MAVVDIEIEQSMASMQVVIELGRVIRDRKVLPVKVRIVVFYVYTPHNIVWVWVCVCRSVHAGVCMHVCCVYRSVHACMLCVQECACVYAVCTGVYMRVCCVYRSVHACMLCVQECACMYAVCTGVCMRVCCVYRSVYAVCAGVCVCLHDCGIAWYMCNAINFHHKVHDHMWSNI